MTPLQTLRDNLNDGTFMKKIEKDANNVSINPEFLRLISERIDHLKKSHTSQRDQ